MKFHRFLKFCLNNCSLIIYNLIIVLFSNCHLSGYPITSIIYYTLFICIFDSKCQFNLIMVANDRGYGLGRAAGEFSVAIAQRKCGRKDCQKHISRPKHIGVC